VRNGQVLALASYPTFDPNAFEKGLTVQEASDLYSEKTGVPALNRALQGLYAPGSTFKAVSVVAAKDAGYDLTKSYACPKEVQVGNRAFQNFESKDSGNSLYEESYCCLLRHYLVSHRLRRVASRWWFKATVEPK
jgi:penicillin-binding protein 2